MELESNFNIEKFLDLIDYATDERIARRKGPKSTQEFFTPFSIVKRMADKIPEEDWSNPNKTFCEPSFGNGNFVLYIIPDINWEDDRVKTDEGLLEVCGCPKDKAKEYAEYCKKIIAEVDKK